MIKDNNKKLKQVIDKIFTKGSRLSKGYNRYAIENIYRELFGDLVSRHTQKISFSKGILTLYINSSPLKEEIKMNKIQMITRLNEKLQYQSVKDIVLR